MYGFTFNNKHSSEFGLYLKTRNLPPLAQRRFSEEIIPLRHSSYKFLDGYADKEISLECTLVDTLGMRRQRIRDIMAWLSDEGELVLDYEQDKYYTAKIFDQVNAYIDPSTDVIILPITVKPFAYSTYINEYVLLDSSMVLYTDVPIEYDLQNNFYVTGYQQATVNNLGTFEASPIIEIDGTATSISISNSDNGFTIQNITEKTYIDCDNMLCYTIDAYGEKINKLSDFTGGFPKIPPGESTFTIDGTSLNVNVLFNYRNTYL